MSKILAQEMVKNFQVMWKEKWKYEWSAASRGKVDCSGAFVYTYRLFGKSIYHGSNRIAREYVVELIPYEEAKAKGLIVPGMAAFRSRKPGQDKYDLPGQYKPGGSHYNGDLNDYNHIGLVDDDINYVLNAANPFARTPITQKWTHVAKLKDVDYGGGPEPMPGKTAIVTAPSGSTVNLRSSKSTESASNIIARVPIGSTVTIVSDEGQWCKIQYGSKVGYMISNYLDYESSPDDTNQDEDNIVVDRDTIQDLYNRAFALCNELSGLLGKG